MKHSYLAATTAAETGDSPDGQVIGRSCSEPELFALVFLRHSASIGLYAARRLGHGPAEDIVAETFLEAFRHRDRYDTTRRDARPWLYGIAGSWRATGGWSTATPRRRRRGRAQRTRRA